MNYSMHTDRQVLVVTVFLSGLLGLTVASVLHADPSTLSPKTGTAIQSEDPLPMKTRRGRCNPADTRCQLPRRPILPKDSDLNERAESGRRLNSESDLNKRSRTGPPIDIDGQTR